MPKSAKRLRSRDAKRDIGSELLRAIREVKAGEGIKYQVAANPGSGSKEEYLEKRFASKWPKGAKQK